MRMDSASAALLVGFVASACGCSEYRSPLTRCELDSECPNRGYCYRGVCVGPCDETGDCVEGRICLRGKCINRESTCSAQNGGCDQNASCTPADIGPTCACNFGFVGDGLSCEDINECEVSNGGCSPVATCENTSGGRTCACPEGYQGDGVRCDDVDECALNNGGCGSDSICKNLPGLRVCYCRPGLFGDGKACFPANQWAWMNPLPQGNDLNAVWGSGPSDAFAVGVKGTILRWNGYSWVAAYVGTDESLTCVWGTGAKDVWAGGRGGVVFHWAGAGWVPSSFPTAGSDIDIQGIWGTDPALFTPSVT